MKKAENNKNSQLHHSHYPFIKKAIGHDEKLVGITHMHWFYVFSGFFWFVLLLAFGFFIETIMWTYFESNVPQYERDILGFTVGSRAALFKWFVAVIGITIFLYALIRYMTTKVALTTRRILIRTGLLFVKVDEVDIEEIKGEHVDHGWFGRFLDYGEIHFDARFVEDIYFPDIASPYRFLRALHEVSTDLTDSVSLSVHEHIKKIS